MLTIEALIENLSRRPDGIRLDAAQRSVVAAPAGDGLRILAGPGTGKTACITARILKLVLVDGVPPAGVLAMTFTRKAAAEMRSRVTVHGVMAG